MADIVAFTPKSGVANEAPRRRRGATAEIVIFPGVRIERWTDETVVPRAQASCRRDRMEIGD